MVLYRWIDNLQWLGRVERIAEDFKEILTTYYYKLWFIILMFVLIFWFIISLRYGLGMV